MSKQKYKIKLFVCLFYFIENDIKFLIRFNVKFACYETNDLSKTIIEILSTRKCCILQLKLVFGAQKLLLNI